MSKLLVVVASLLAVSMGCKREAPPEPATTQAGLETNTQAEAPTEIRWLTDVSRAVDQAKRENKVVFLNFTGSDFCAPCILLELEVFTQKEFVEYAHTNLVSVKLDYPKRTEQPEALRKMNAVRSLMYKVEGFPTFLVLDGDGKELGRFNYILGGPPAFIAEIEKLKKTPGPQG